MTKSGCLSRRVSHSVYLAGCIPVGPYIPLSPLQPVNQHCGLEARSGSGLHVSGPFRLCVWVFLFPCCKEPFMLALSQSSVLWVVCTQEGFTGTA